MLGEMADAKKLWASMKNAMFKGISHYICSVILTTSVVLKIWPFPMGGNLLARVKTSHKHYPLLPVPILCAGEGWSEGFHHDT
jgi:hypothetical protein